MEEINAGTSPAETLIEDGIEDAERARRWGGRAKVEFLIFNFCLGFWSYPNFFRGNLVILI